jgi:hypothetical protein
MSSMVQCLDHNIISVWLLQLVGIYRTKQKAIPVTGLGGLEGCEMLKIPHSLDKRLTDGGNVVSPKH